MTRTVATAAQVEAVRKAVIKRYASWFAPLVLDDGTTYEPMAKESDVLVLDYDGTPVVSWEEGPDEWAYQFTMGGSTEEERVMAASAAQEFGHPDYRAAEPEPVKVAAKVEVEPYYSFSLAVYPA
jgi:hypothetical protein